ncbi:MAG: sulfotransferase [Anaerolineae bacterium]
MRRWAKQTLGSAVFHGELLRAAVLVKNYVASSFACMAYPDAFKDVKACCMFVGHMKSGGSMIGALLDAHPNAIIADEVDAPHLLSAGFSRDRLFHVLLHASKRELQKGRVTARRLHAYSWLVPGQWQGRYSSLHVIGTSATGTTTQQIGSSRALLGKIRDRLEGIALRLIHVIRNPYDPIALSMIRGQRSFESASARYFQTCELLQNLGRSLAHSEMLRVRYEDFVGSPAVTLAGVGRYLGLDAAPDYLSACAGIIHPLPEQSRRLVEWQPAWVDSVRERMQQYDFLAGYAFEHKDLEPQPEGALVG